MKFGLQVLMIAGVLWLASAAHARTWHIELDGSGDFTDIQPAVEAATAGDTIRIGPGRFDTFHPCYAPGWVEDVIIWATKDNLTFIGSGQDVTVVGPVSFYAPVGKNPKAFCAYGGLDAVVQTMTIENVETGIMWERGVLAIEACTFRAQDPNAFALYLFVDSASVHNCLFDLPLGGSAIGILNTLNNVSGFDVSGCVIAGARFGVRVAYGAQNVNVSDCVLNVGYLGLVYDQLSTGLIQRCHITSSEQGSLVVVNGSNVQVVDSELQGGRRGVDVGAGAEVLGSGLVIFDTTESALTLSGGGRATIHGSHFLPATGWAVNGLPFTGAAVTVDLTGNYWGTSDASVIGSLIHDSQYYSPNPYTVVYSPFANGPVPTESTSWGDLKALWR